MKIKYLKKQVKAADVRLRMTQCGITETLANKLNTLVVNEEDKASVYGMRQAAVGLHVVSPIIEMKYRDHDFIKALKTLGIYSINCISRDKDEWVFVIAAPSGNSYAFKEPRKNPYGGVYSQLELTVMAVCEYHSVCHLPDILATYIFFSVPTSGNVLLDGNMQTYQDLKTIDGTESNQDAVVETMPQMPVMGKMTLDQAPLGLKEAFMKTMAEEAEKNKA